ncbi:HlyD family secretion protein [Granulicella tundricola]|uniref:Secretion protein HlyD family protein n=1 Tax=Granulicella tundricola (strain ATCC BAA-1859 / DSM 23138 / MP5ACTX9) TaxID=1198114 RepID=E8X0T2_GRATM|nr:HlyD family secretion protein [Granulicella tundricola]ADW70116.1 secretion protein HlyD family protein [Granulicella tundricola MP5ACTX9]
MSDINSNHSRISVSLTVVALLILLCGGAFLWSRDHGSVSTDDAQVDGHVHPINARVGGTVVWVNPDIDDTKFVKAGTVLAHLDTNDYQPAIDRLEGDVQAQQAQLQTAELAVPITQTTSSSKLASAHDSEAEAEAELASAKAGVRAASAQVQQAEASSRRAENDRARYEQLVNSHEISRSEYDTRMTDANVTAAQLSAAQANLQAADQKVQAAEQHIAERKQDVLSAATAPELVATARSSVERVSGELKKSKAALHDAQLNLGYTDIIAPVSGIVGRRSIETGQRIAPGQLLLNIVPTDDIWVTANYKETQLRHVQPGAPVTIHIDTYGSDIQGSVESIGGATGSKYALIAPDNATGNYVKVVQRIPVRIRLKTVLADGRPLLPGMSVETSVR